MNQGLLRWLVVPLAIGLVAGCASAPSTPGQTPSASLAPQNEHETTCQLSLLLPITDHPAVRTAKRYEAVASDQFYTQVRADLDQDRALTLMLETLEFQTAARAHAREAIARRLANAHWAHVAEPHGEPLPMRRMLLGGWQLEGCPTTRAVLLLAQAFADPPPEEQELPFVLVLTYDTSVAEPVLVDAQALARPGASLLAHAARLQAALEVARRAPDVGPGSLLEQFARFDTLHDALVAENERAGILREHFDARTEMQRIYKNFPDWLARNYFVQRAADLASAKRPLKPRDVKTDLDRNWSSEWMLGSVRAYAVRYMTHMEDGEFAEALETLKKVFELIAVDVIGGHYLALRVSGAKFNERYLEFREIHSAD